MFQNLNLKHNPFINLTPELATGQVVVWAGMADIKSKLEKVYKDAETTNQKQVILNWGPWGGGKTHAAMYFTNLKFEGENFTQTYIQAPKKGNSATDEFFVNILDSITFEKIVEQISTLVGEMGEEEFINAIGNKISSREFAKAISMLASDEEDVLEVMRRYFYNGVTKADLKKLKLPRDMVSDADTIKVLTGIIYCFIGDGTFYDGKFCLWIDEMEDLIYYSSTHYRGFSQVLRELIDRLNERVTFFFNFTLSESEEKTIELILGAALWSRISRKVRFKELTLEDAKQYIQDLLQSAKIQKRQHAPIAENQINYLLTFIPQSNLTPREINRAMSGILDVAREQNMTVIDNAIIDSYMHQKNEDE